MSLVLRFGGSLVEQLGAQLYPSATATVAELISNAWDADAKNVWITIPFGESWDDGEIVAIDDGHGMNHDEAQESYLVVGRRRRLSDGGTSRGGRKVHGRKGIGKLAAFGTARILECRTSAADGGTHFRLDYDEIRRLAPTADYVVEELPMDDLLVPDGTTLATGTRVRLTSLFLRRALSEEQFVRSMSRRFALSQTEMRVFINGTPLERFDMNVEFRFPRDDAPEGVTVAADGWAEEELDGNLVRWWIGFTEKPLTDESLQGVSILARGKMAQRPFKFERTQGTEGQLGQEYLVGEIAADWLDDGVDIEHDFIQSNRDQLQLEDQRLDSLLVWGRKRLSWALRARNDLRRDKNLAQYESDERIDDLIKDLTRNEQRRYRKVAEIVSKLPEIESGGVVNVMSSVIDARADVAVRQMMEDIERMDDLVQEQMWRLVTDFGLIDARRNASIIEARLATIEKLQHGVASGMREVPEIHEIVRNDPWLLDPRWHLLNDEVRIEDLDVGFDPEEDEDGQRLDYLFVLAPTAPATVDEVVVVEIKRGYYKDGRVRKVSEPEVNKFVGYVEAVERHFSKESRPPSIHGLMIAQDYSDRAERRRRTFEKVPSPRYEFRTWNRVIDETQRMHTGWLVVSKKRASREEPEEPEEPTAS